jgi:Zn ribbon nucleic-acid-binding protein
MQMKNIQIGGRTCPVCEFEDTMVLDSELETNMEIK